MLLFSVKTVVMSGKAPVDTDCPLVGKAHVYYEGKDIYDCMLNQVNPIIIKDNAAKLTLVIVIPPVYEVYRGYIVFVFSVTMFVCVFVFV